MNTLVEVEQRLAEVEKLVAVLVDNVNLLRGDKHLQEHPPAAPKRGPGRPRKVEDVAE